MKCNGFVLMAVSLVLGGCGSPVTPSVAPESGVAISSVAASSDLPSRSPEATPSPTSTPPPLLVADDIAEVVTNDLVVRSLPEISDASLINPVRLNPGTLLFVLHGPVLADGYEWYRVAPFEALVSDIATEEPGIGWVAAGRDAEAWIAPWVGQCPAAEVGQLMFRHELLRLGCFGNEEITLAGTILDCGGVTGSGWEPLWLANSYCPLVPRGFEPGIFGGLPLRSRDLVQVLYEFVGRQVRVIGHFDDSAARRCRDATDRDDRETVVLSCRAQFVVTDVSEVPG